MEKNTQLCPNCKTGLESYLLDKQSPMCPYIHLHQSDGCTMYKELLDTKETEN